ncbi:MAG: hypothetical protein HQL54_07490 [Magnetococcales bacterium]|nr:hypothetical protein [Magnetococcales bacterium]
MIQILFKFISAVLLLTIASTALAEAPEKVEKEVIMRRGELAELFGESSGPDSRYPVMGGTGAAAVSCSPLVIRRVPVAAFGHVNVQRNRQGTITLVGMTPPPNAYGRFEIVDAGLPEGFFGLMSSSSGDYFHVVEVLGWDPKMPTNSYRKSAVAFRDGNEVMDACFGNH